MKTNENPKPKNKIRRQTLYRTSKIEKAKTKLAERRDRAKAETENPKLKEVKPP